MADRHTYIAAGLVGLVLFAAALLLSGIARLIDPVDERPDRGSPDAVVAPSP